MYMYTIMRVVPDFLLSRKPIQYSEERRRWLLCYLELVTGGRELGTELFPA